MKTCQKNDLAGIEAAITDHARALKAAFSEMAHAITDHAHMVTQGRDAARIDQERMNWFENLLASMTAEEKRSCPIHDIMRECRAKTLREAIDFGMRKNSISADPMQPVGNKSAGVHGPFTKPPENGGFRPKFSKPHPTPTDPA